jgi:hypothetical protein
MEHTAYTGEMRNAYKILDRKPQSTIPLERPGHRWGHKINKKYVVRVWT